MSNVRDFVDFWLENSVHADEQMSARRRRDEIQKLADKLVTAAENEGSANPS
jgi:hypothetical protein